MSHLADPEFVERQYADSSNFDARVRLYRYAQAEEPLPDWIFRHIGLASGEKVLELGSGPGNLWRAAGDRLPDGVDVTLSDQSAGMIQEARRRLAPLAHEFRYAQLDAQSISYPDASFDVVIASHMLYHVPDRPRAIGEVARVLRCGGRFYAVTNEWTHLIELRELCERFGFESEMRPPRRDTALFDVETAIDELGARFDQLALTRRHDCLEVESADALVDYLGSMSRAEEPAKNRIRDHVAAQIDRIGAFHITISVALIECRNLGDGP